MPRNKVPKVKPTISRQQARRTKRQMAKFAVKPENKGALSRVMTADQYSRDARHQHPGASALELGNQIKSETILCNLSAQALYGVMISYVTLALQKGFAGTAEQPQDPYYAAKFGWGIISAFATGDVPQVESMPYWMLCLCQALSPANVPFQQAKIAYSWKIDGGSPSNSNVLIGWPSYGYMWNANYPASSGQVDLFPVSVNFTDSAYTTALGASAFSQLINFMANNAVGEAIQISKIVPVATKTGYETNVSCFGVNTSATGGGYANIGGFVEMAQLEVPIFDPLFAVFSPNIVNNQTDRFFNLVAATSGDSVFLGGAMASLFPPGQWGQKRYPKFHAVDFLEFGDVLAQWVALIQTALVNDPQTQTSNEIGGGSPVDLICPLTLLEMLLLLRNVIMSALKDTQALVQGLYPRQPNAGDQNEFVAYVASATTCPINSGNMQLPNFMIENIRALVARWSTMGGAPKPGKKVSPSDVQWWIPVLGQYQNAVLNGPDYTYTIAMDGTVLPSFTTTSLERRRRDSKVKGGEVREAMSETPISLVDGSSVLSSNPVFVYINDPGRLRQLESIWNTWISTVGVSNFSSNLGTMGTELGISVLTSIAMTRHWIPITENVHHQKIVPVADDVIDKRLIERRLANTVYSQQQAIADSSQSIILAAPYEQVLNTWILPVNLALLPANSLLTDSTALPRWQSLMGEPYAASYTSGQTGMLMSMQHAVYAAKMTRTRNTPESDVDTLIKLLAQQGRGGILSGLAASFIGSVFPAASGLASTVASVLPF